MRVLVTGGAGFIGSHLVDAYLARGDEVVILDNFVLGLKENVNPAAALYAIDLADRDAVEAVLLDFQPELVSHQAAHLSVYQSVEDPQYNAIVNVLGFLNLMESAVSAGVQRVVVASSGGVIYGNDVPVPTAEAATPSPVSPYGVSKLAMEAYLHYYSVQYGLDWVALRYGNVYGPRQNPKGETGVISVFLEQMAAGRQPTINGDGKQTRDYVYVADVVAANLAASERGSGAYNVGTGQETDVITVFRTLQAALKTDFPKQFGLARSGEQRRSVLDCRRAQEELGWEAGTTFERGVQATVRWYQDR